MDQFLAMSAEARSAQKKRSTSSKSASSSAKPRRKLGAVKLRALDEENVPGRIVWTAHRSVCVCVCVFYNAVRDEWLSASGMNRPGKH